MLGKNSPNSKILAMCPPWAKEQEVHGFVFFLFSICLSLLLPKIQYLNVTRKKNNIKKYILQEKSKIEMMYPMEKYVSSDFNKRLAEE